jgi:hypothetical protein
MKTELKELREQSEAMTEERDLRLLHRELNELRADNTALERGQDFMESWGSCVDPLEYLRDDPDYSVGYGSGRQIISRVDDRQNGANRPTFETESQLATIRGAMRVVCDELPMAITAKENLLSFVLGTGFAYKATAEDGCPDGLLGAVQSAVKLFLRKNKWGKLEEEAYWRPHRDGEGLLALFVQPGEMPELRIVEPEQLVEPTSPSDIERWLMDVAIGDWDGETPSNWSFGVHSQEGRPEKIWGYYVQWSDNPQDWDYIPVDRMIHTKLNVDDKIKRGISDFYPVESYLTNIAKLDRNVGIGAAVLAAIIGIVQHRSASQSQVHGMASTNVWNSRTVTSPAGSTRRENTQKIQPGSFVHTPGDSEYQGSPLANQGVGQAFVVIHQALMRVFGGRWLMPEYMISMDASNANYSSTLVAESPFVKFVERQQRDFSEMTAELLWKALDILARAGWFRSWGIETVEELALCVDLKITGPMVAARDKAVETNRNSLLNEKGQLSDESWAEREGLDRDVELKRGAKRVEVVVKPDDREPNRQSSADPTTPRQIAADDPTPVDSAPDAPENITATQTLNGAQITAAKDVLAAVAAGDTATTVGIELLVSLGFDRRKAETMTTASSELAKSKIPVEP